MVKRNQFVIISIITVILLAIYGIFFMQLRDELKVTQSQIVLLQHNADELIIYNSLLKGEVATSQLDVTTLQKDIAKLQNDVTTLKSHDFASIDIATLLEPSLVKIELSNNNGSGVIISKTGQVITNYHVIAKEVSVKVVLMSGDKYDAIVVDKREDQDLAILKIVSDRADFPIAKLGSSANVVPGEEVLAIGYPYSYDLTGQVTFTKGIVSALQLMDDRRWIQTDAAINRGCSGGPLVDFHGEVIGINTKVLVDEYIGEGVVGLSFAIPIDEVKTFIRDTIGK
jgi:S1-C subfamily serine protease